MVTRIKIDVQAISHLSGNSLKICKMKKSVKFLVLGSAISLVLAACSDNTHDVNHRNHPSIPIINNTVPKAKTWFDQGAAIVSTAAARTMTTEKGKAKNIILFIGDGMGVSTVTAARILAGQRAGKYGEEHQLSFDKFPFSGFSKTYNTNQQTPDSAGTMTAIITGVKTKAGVLSVAESVVRGNCASSQGLELGTALEMAENVGKATGIISTARITHATPAATYAKSSERNWEGDYQLSEEAKKNGCKDIADQLINFNYGDGIEVVMGGGRRNFLPTTSTDIEGKAGKRIDGRNLIAEWKSKYPTGRYIKTKAELEAVDTNSTDKLFGLFNSSSMHYEADRANDIGGEPSIAEMTAKAIDQLKKDKDGFFLMVESGRIDHAHHIGNAYHALNETIALSDAVQIAVDKTSKQDTLIIVTADHSHAFTIAGYPTRGNPILGKVIGNDEQGNPETELSKAEDGLPYTTLGYANGRGFVNLGKESNADIRYAKPVDAGRKDLTMIDTRQSGYHQEALIPHGIETHAAEDVGIYALGPGAHLLTGVNEQNVIFHVMNRMADLDR